VQSGVQQPPAMFINGVGQVAPYDYDTCLSAIRSAHHASYATDK